MTADENAKTEAVVKAANIVDESRSVYNGGLSLAVENGFDDVVM